MSLNWIDEITKKTIKVDGFSKSNEIKKKWICTECGTEVISKEYPHFPQWSDGHKCTFKEEK